MRVFTWDHSEEVSTDSSHPDVQEKAVAFGQPLRDAYWGDLIFSATPHRQGGKALAIYDLKSSCKGNRTGIIAFYWTLIRTYSTLTGGVMKRLFVFTGLLRGE